jgi:tetratricopeptide (TPR) repeat protein
VEAGRYLQAWSAAQARGPLASWTPTAERILAGRLAMALGAPRLGFSLHLRAHRAAPDDPEAHYYRARAMLSLRGPFAAWRFMRGSELPSPAPVEVRADWLALAATVATGFRDFETAEKRLGEAAALCPDRPWIAVEHTAVLEEQDRLEEALDRISETLRASPFFRPGIGASARLLERLGRFEEAIALLRSADEELETGSLAAHLAQILIDLDRPQEALVALDRFATLSPLLEGPGKSWLAARRSDAAYALGDFETAQREAEAAGNPFHTEVARRLRKPPAERPRRVLLAVPFIQQQHLTCSPTALASLTCYWQKPVDHVALASEIAYDGTPGHRERQWARSHGWREREFRLTAEAARTLLDRGIPFTLCTQYATSAHAQAVAGCDPLRGTLLVRDPSFPRLVELMLEPLIEQQASHGPRCLALVPADELSEVELPELPDQREYDELHELELCLLRHDRSRAQVLRNALFVREPDHLLRLFMDARLSAYDDDPQALLPIYEALSARFPKSDLYALRRVDLLLQLGRRDEAVAALEPRAHPFQADPVFAIRLAEVLADDARREGEALRLVERALRMRPADAPALSVLAGLVYGQGRREEAFELYRLAACADIHNEARIDRYVTTAQVLDRAAEAWHSCASGSRGSATAPPPRPQPVPRARRPGRIDEGLDALDAALARHPDDGDLLLFAAEAQGRYGRLARAQELLAAASGRARRATAGAPRRGSPGAPETSARASRPGPPSPPPSRWRSTRSACVPSCCCGSRDGRRPSSTWRPPPRVSPATSACSGCWWSGCATTRRARSRCCARCCSATRPTRGRTASSRSCSRSRGGSRNRSRRSSAAPSSSPKRPRRSACAGWCWRRRAAARKRRSASARRSSARSTTAPRWRG